MRSWDLTRLRGPSKWEGYWLYVLLDVYSRLVVGWMVARVQRERLAQDLIRDSIDKQYVPRDQLTIHADRGAIILAKSVYQLYTDLGVTHSHSRPHAAPMTIRFPRHTSRKTVKYHPSYPATFDLQDHARWRFRDLFRGYNAEHRHSGISLLTPESVHYGFAPLVIERCQAILDTASRPTRSASYGVPRLRRPFPRPIGSTRHAPGLP